ncbi:MAG: lyase [Xanthobacteraceae bacterium]
MNRRQFLACSAAGALVAPVLLRPAPAATSENFRVKYFPVPDAQRSRDVTACSDGVTMWFNCQGNGKLGRLDPRDGSYKLTDLGQGSAPHGVIVGPDKAAWVTDGGQNAIVRVDNDHKVTVFKLPIKEYTNLNTAAFDKDGIYWFTGQSGYHGRLDPKSGKIDVFKSPGGHGSYGMTVTPSGDIWYASLAGNHIAKIDRATGNAKIVDPTIPKQGARRVWSDSKGRIWVSEWNTGNVSVYDPAADTWGVWRLPGERPRTYSVYVDEKDKVWLTDFGGNAIVWFDPMTNEFNSFPSNKPNANVRQMDGKPGQAWGGESGTNRLVMIETLQPPA